MKYLLAAMATVAMVLATAIPAHADGVTATPAFPGRVQLGNPFEATVTIGNTGPDRVQVGTVELIPACAPALCPEAGIVVAFPTVRATADGLAVAGSDEVSVFPR